MKINSKIAILYFTLNPGYETKLKSIQHGARKNLGLLKFLNKYTFNILKQAGFDIIVWDETRQKGGSFGAKFSHAFRSVFDMGYKHIIAVGNDCLSLNKNDILDASEALEAGNAVFGPAGDGGVYLLGLRKEAFDELGLENIPWRTASVLTALLTDYANYRLLNEKTDIDSYRDILVIVGAQDIAFKIRAVLLDFLNFFIHRYAVISLRFKSVTNFAFSSRPPPVCL
ncbi:MAG: DUF2064 domain-containing protein [Bacteroidetes bacterium]|nr:DUF2064 domain-containing protein [Bacteroidota bacterium]MCH8233490.1 DUF2064 domain-containing protein [Bacteroidota bacterium]